MKKFLFIISILSLFVVVSACTSKRNHVWVYDYEGVLTQSEEQKLHGLFNSHENRTTNEIALVTTSDFGLDTSILFYSVNFLRNQGIGKTDKNNGVVIVYSGTLKQVRIGTGYGTEKVLKDEIAKRIIDSCMIPEFRKGNAFAGLWKGSEAIVKFLDQPENKIP